MGRGEEKTSSRILQGEGLRSLEAERLLEFYRAHALGAGEGGLTTLKKSMSGVHCRHDGRLKICDFMFQRFRRGLRPAMLAA